MKITYTVVNAATLALFGPSVNGLAVDLLLEEANVAGTAILQQPDELV